MLSVRPGILFVDRHRPRPSACNQAYTENRERDAEQLRPTQGLTVKQGAHRQAEDRDQETEALIRTG